MELKSGDLFFLIRKEENGEDESAKRSKCWTVHSWVERIILINISSW